MLKQAEHIAVVAQLQVAQDFPLAPELQGGLLMHAGRTAKQSPFCASTEQGIHQFLQVIRQAIRHRLGVQHTAHRRKGMQPGEQPFQQLTLRTARLIEEHSSAHAPRGHHPTLTIGIGQGVEAGYLRILLQDLFQLKHSLSGC